MKKKNNKFKIIIGDNMQKNLKLIDKTIMFLIKELNSNNINYYIVGAIGGYIDAKVPMKRIHDDLDLMIEEKDIARVKEVFANSEYTFYDNRYNNKKTLNENGYTDGDHEVFAMHNDSDFHIGFFLFGKDKEKYTIIEYFTENNICKRLERSLPIDVFKYQYNEEAMYNDIKVKVARKELIYKNKKVMNREKDIFDVNNLEEKINWRILDKLKGLSKLRITKIVEV